MSSDKKKVFPLPKSGNPAGQASPHTKSVSRAELELMVKKAREMAKNAPQKAAMILTDWLNKPRKLSNIREQASTPAAKSTATPKKKAG